MSCCEPTVSVACSPPSIHTMALPSLASARFLLADALGMGQLAGDFLVAREFLHVLRRRDDGHPLVAAFLGLADALQLHARALGGQLLPVGLQLGVVGDLVIVAEIEPERFLGCGDFGEPFVRAAGKRTGLLQPRSFRGEIVVRYFARCEFNPIESPHTLSTPGGLRSSRHGDYQHGLQGCSSGVSGVSQENVAEGLRWCQRAIRIDGTETHSCPKQVLAV